MLSSEITQSLDAVVSEVLREITDRVQSTLRSYEMPEDVELSCLDTAIESVDYIKSALQSNLLQHSCRLRESRNRLPAINRLPLELLVNILHESTCVEPWKLATIKRTAGVCRYWYNIIASTSIFWPEVSNAFSTSILNSVLEHNTSGLLCVKLDSKGSTSHRQAFVDSVSRRSAQWKAIQIDGAASQDTLRLLSISAPNLRTLSIHNFREDEEVVGANVPTLLPSSSGLEALDIENSRIRWHTLPHTQLLSLRLSRIHIPSRSVLDSLQAVLSTSSDTLESLILENLTGSIPSGPETPASEIHFPALFVLRIHGVSDAITNDLVPLISAPYCDYLVITTRTGPMRPNKRGVAVREITAALGATLSWNSTWFTDLRVIYDVDNETIAFKTELHRISRSSWRDTERGIDVQIRIPCSNDANFWELCAPIVQRRHPRDPTFKLTILGLSGFRPNNGPSHPPQREFRSQQIVADAFHPWSNVTHLTISDVRMLQTFANPLTNGKDADPSGKRYWLVSPKLEEVHIPTDACRRWQSDWVCWQVLKLANGRWDVFQKENKASDIRLMSKIILPADIIAGMKQHAEWRPEVWEATTLEAVAP